MRKSAQPATRGRVSGFPINLIQTQVEASSVTMHHQAYKSSCPALASCSLGILLAGAHPSMGGMFQATGHKVGASANLLMCTLLTSSLLHTSNPSQQLMLPPAAPPHKAPNPEHLNSATVTWLYALYLLHTLQVPYKDPGSAWKFWPWCLLPFNSEFTPYWGILVWIPFDRSHLTKIHLPHTLFPLPF